MGSIPLSILVDTYITSMTDLSKVSIVDTLRKTNGWQAFSRPVSAICPSAKWIGETAMRMVVRLMILIIVLIEAAIAFERVLPRGRELGLI
ncbi:MAG: hypothetical protein K8L97_19625 [Anaerolineae bacterium]|nr:hypothetical protein [Anaerolineae bacterium]